CSALAPTGHGPLLGGGCAMLLIIEAEPFGDEKQRAALHLFIDAPEILADDAERDELYAGKEHHRDDQRWKAGSIAAVNQGFDEDDDGVAEGKQRDQQA